MDYFTTITLLYNCYKTMRKENLYKRVFIEKNFCWPQGHWVDVKNTKHCDFYIRKSWYKERIRIFATHNRIYYVGVFRS